MKKYTLTDILTMIILWPFFLVISIAYLFISYLDRNKKPEHLFDWKKAYEEGGHHGKR